MFNSIQGQMLNTTVCVSQICILSHVLLHFFLEEIWLEFKINIYLQYQLVAISNLRFVENIDLIAG